VQQQPTRHHHDQRHQIQGTVTPPISVAQTHWHFSFGDYRDPGNVQWSKLRVFNDDVVQGGGGFDLHPHRDMEIVTYVLTASWRTATAPATRGVVRSGEVQVMSAGKGIFHAEHNASAEKPVRLLQIWIQPRSQGNQPRWEQRQFGKDGRAAGCCRSCRAATSTRR
jgi:redox-sensitive bicupin YhaK (pirin superfamily)